MSAQSANPQYLTVHQLSAEVQSGRLSPVELMDSLLDRIAKHDRKLHAFITLYRDEARLAAEAADKAIRAGYSVGPLHGIPIALKDLVEIEGRVTTGGSKVWQDRVSPTTATLVRKAKAAGMIVIGKTHSVEFAMGGWGTNQHMGTPWNPWDPETLRTPGGSSSGSGVAVAARLVPCAIGTDTGGSVRLPASWCGVSRSENDGGSNQYAWNSATRANPRYAWTNDPLRRGRGDAFQHSARFRSVRCSHIVPPARRSDADPAARRRRVATSRPARGGANRGRSRSACRL